MLKVYCAMLGEVRGREERVGIGCPGIEPVRLVLIMSL